MTEEEKFTAINKHTAAALEPLLQDLEKRHGDEEYETEFLGDLYARMIVSVYMGYRPERMSKDAEDGAIRLMQMSGIDMEEIEE